MKKRRLFLITTGLLFMATALIAQRQIEVEMWPVHENSSHMYYEYDEIDYFIRPAESCYISILLVDPDGFVNVLYPLRRHQYYLRRGRTYQISQFLDAPLYYYDKHGDGMISVIASPQPFTIGPRLIDDFEIFLSDWYRPSVHLEINFGPNFRVNWHRHLRKFGYGTCSINFHIKPSPHYRKKPLYWHSRRAKPPWYYRSNSPIVRHNEPIKYRKSDRRTNWSNNRREINRPEPQNRRDTYRRNETYKRDDNNRQRPDNRRSMDNKRETRKSEAPKQKRTVRKKSNKSSDSKSGKRGDNNSSSKRKRKN